MRVRAGFAAVAAAAVLWAVGGTFARYLIDRGASFVELTEARAWIAAVVLGIWIAVRPDRGRSPGRVPLGAVLLFGSSLAAANFTYYASLSRLPVAVAITVQYTAPGLVVLWAALAGRQRPARRVVVALVGAMAGVALLAEVPVVLSEGRFRLDALGMASAGLSAFAFATYMITGERIATTLGARRSVFYGFVVASVLWIVVQAVRGRPDTLLTSRFVPGVVFLAFATTVVPFWLFAWGLERVRATDAGIVSTLEPMTATLIAFVWLGQSLTLWQLAGAALVIVGIAIVQVERPQGADVLAERAAVE